MKKQITIQQYRNIDLGIMLVIQLISQALIHFAANSWFPDQLYVVSPVAAVTVLVMMRWGGFAAIHAMVGGLVFTALSGGNPGHYLIYGLGNAGALLALLAFRLFDKERIRKSAFLSLMLALLVQALMWLGLAGMAALFGNEPAACLSFITTDILSGLFTLLIVWVVRRIDGLFEDQKHYLIRMERERQAERRESH